MTPAELKRAECREETGVDPELFFPLGREDLWPIEAVLEAKEVCARCPITSECLRWANRTGQGYGIWGGQTPDERKGTKHVWLLPQLIRERNGAPAELARELTGDRRALRKELVRR